MISRARCLRVVLGTVALASATATLTPALASTTADPNAALPGMGAVGQVVGAQTGWRVGANGHGIDVALLDTGVTPVRGLDGTDKVVYGPDLSFDSQNPALTHLDGYGHGTAMAGIIAGNDGATGYNGIAPSARIVSVKVGASNGATDVSQMIAGIDWVTQHAHDPGLNIRVLNLSLGTNSLQSYQLDPLAHAAEMAWQHGIVVVVAVGNDGTSSTNVADPASDPYVLAVGSENPMGTIAYDDDVVSSFSQRGTARRHADLVAPGNKIMGLLAPGSTLATAYPEAVFGGRFLRGSGTSQAAAVTSGVVADLLSVRPGLAPDQVKRILMATAVDIDTDRPVFVGAGLVQLPAALDAPTPNATQAFAPSSGAGSLEQARGTGHVSLDGVTLTGEQDIFGAGWNSAALAVQEESASTWAGGVFNGSTWSGSTWSGSTWSGSTWSGSTWSGSAWLGATWN